MVAIGFALAALAVWLIDSAVRNRPPIQTLKQAVTTGTLPATGQTMSGSGSITGTQVANTAYVTPTVGGTGVTLPSSNDWVIDSSTNGYTGNSYDEPGMARPSGTLDDWIAQANTVLQQNGDAGLSGQDVQAIRLMVQNESGGDPLIINGYDSNARAGHASKGLLQDIQSTFMKWADPGHHNIFNPVDNIVASVRYARARYGSLSQVPGVEDVNNGGGYVGY